jgi:hypothetical protein
VQFGASEEDAGDVGCQGRCDEWEIDPTLLRPEHRLDRFDGARRLTGTGADAVVRLHQTRCASHEPSRMFRTGSDASARADTFVGVTDWMARQGLCDRLDRLGPASAAVGFLLAVATVRYGPMQGSAAEASAAW